MTNLATATNQRGAPVFQLAQEPRRIAIFRALFLGDLLCSVPALRALRQRFPEAEITLIGLPWARDLMQRLHYVDKLQIFPGYQGLIEVQYDEEKTCRFLDAAREEDYDLAIQMHGDGRISNGFVSDLGARASLGYRRGADQRLSHSLAYEENQHEVLRWLRLVGAVGACVDDIRLECPTSPAEQARAKALLAKAGGSGPLIGLHSGAKDAARRWPAERFAALADLLVEQYGARIVLTGNAAEREITGSLRRAMRHKALDLAGETDLGTFAALLGQLDLLVTNDTGASHLAAATGTRSVVLFGPTRPECWAPLDRRRHLVIDAPLLVGWDFNPMNALAQLPVEPVFAACIDSLGLSLKEVACGA